MDGFVDWVKSWYIFGLFHVCTPPLLRIDLREICSYEHSKVLISNLNGVLERDKGEKDRKIANF